MATATPSTINLQLTYEEARTLTEILYVCQRGRTGRGAIVSKIDQALEEAGISPEFDQDWLDSLMDGSIIDVASLETGVYFTEHGRPLG